MTIHIPTPKLPNIKFLNRSVILVALAAVLVLGLTAYGAVRNVQAERAAAVAQEAEQEKALAAVKATDAKLKALTAENTALAAEAKEKDFACLELKRLDGIRAITSQVTVPAYCQ